MGPISLHVEVKLKSGIEGRIIGVFQESPGGDMQYLVQFWAANGEQKSC